MNNSLNNFDSVNNNLLENIRQNNIKPVLKFFKDYLLKSTKSEYNISSQQFMDLLANLLNENYDIFQKKLSNPVIEYLTRRFSYIELISLERYLLERYCLVEGEEIKAYFVGKIVEGKAYVIGNNFLTNYRIIAVGKLGSSSGFFSFMFWGPAFSGIDRMKAKKKLRREQNALEFLAQKPIFGSQFPIIGLISKNIRYSSNKFSYKINIQYQEGSKIKTLKMKPTVVILKNREESGREYRKRLNDITHRVEDVMSAAHNISQQFQEPIEAPNPEVEIPNSEVKTPNPTENNILCPQCNVLIKSTDKFCEHCGYKLINE